MIQLQAIDGITLADGVNNPRLATAREVYEAVQRLMGSYSDTGIGPKTRLRERKNDAGRYIPSTRTYDVVFDGTVIASYTPDGLTLQGGINRSPAVLDRLDVMLFPFGGRVYGGSTLLFQDGRRIDLHREPVTLPYEREEV